MTQTSTTSIIENHAVWTYLKFYYLCDGSNLTIHCLFFFCDLLHHLWQLVCFPYITLYLLLFLHWQVICSPRPLFTCCLLLCLSCLPPGLPWLTPQRTAVLTLPEIWDQSYLSFVTNGSSLPSALYSSWWNCSNHLPWPQRWMLCCVWLALEPSAVFVARSLTAPHSKWEWTIFSTTFLPSSPLTCFLFLFYNFFLIPCQDFSWMFCSSACLPALLQYSWDLKSLLLHLRVYLSFIPLH